MENAIHAFIMGAAMLIAVMVLSVLVYMFRTGARLGETYELTQSSAQVTKFNGQFDAFSKKTEQLTDSDFGYSFITKGNTASDIITCANLAMSVNSTNDFDRVNSLEVVVLCEDKKYAVYPAKSQPKNSFLIGFDTETARSRTEFDESDTYKFYKFLKDYNEARMVDIVSDEYKSYGETIYKYYFDVDEGEDGTEGEGLQYSDVTRKS